MINGILVNVDGQKNLTLQPSYYRVRFVEERPRWGKAIVYILPIVLDVGYQHKDKRLLMELLIFGTPAPPLPLRVGRKGKIMIKEIQLTQGEVALVDDEDFEWLNKWKWHVMKEKGKIKKVSRSTKFSDGVERNLFIHRLITGLQFGDKRQVDHINGNPLDNRRTNLRLCNAAQNCQNKGLGKRNKSGYKGITWDKIKKKWRVHIESNGKAYNFGRFIEKENAAMVYNEVARKYHGEFACQNEAVQ